MAERVLVVEDEPLIAFDVADHLREAGFEIVGPAASVAVRPCLILKAASISAATIFFWP